MTKVDLGRFASLDVDVGRLPVASREYIFAYGLKQVLNDAHASITTTTHPNEDKRNAAKLAAAEARLERLYAGEVRATRAGGDPVEREMRILAEKRVKDRIRAAGRRVKEFDAEAIAHATDTVLAKAADELRAQAEAIVAARREKPEVEVDLSDLGL